MCVCICLFQICLHCGQRRSGRRWGRGSLTCLRMKLWLQSSLRYCQLCSYLSASYNIDNHAELCHFLRVICKRGLGLTVHLCVCLFVSGSACRQCSLFQGRDETGGCWPHCSYFHQACHCHQGNRLSCQICLCYAAMFFSPVCYLLAVDVCAFCLHFQTNQEGITPHSSAWQKQCSFEICYLTTRPDRFPWLDAALIVAEWEEKKKQLSLGNDFNRP